MLPVDLVCSCSLYQLLMNFSNFVFGVLFSIVDFFKELPQFVVKAGPILSNLYGIDWESKLEVFSCQRFC